MRFIFFLALLYLGSAGAASAACVDPAGEEAVIVYNTNTKGLQFCNGAQWVAIGSGVATVAAGSTMVTGWPDALVCSLANGTKTIFNAQYLPWGASNLYYYNMETDALTPDPVRFVFNPDGSYNGNQNATGYADCMNKSITDLYLAGKAINLNGGGGGVGGSSGASASMVDGWPDALRCSLGTSTITLINTETGSSNTKNYRYINSPISGLDYGVAFNSDGTFNTHANMTGSDCVTGSPTIAQNYAASRAFNFVGTGATVDTLSSLSCTNGQFAKWDGTAWGCGTVASGGGGGGGVSTTLASSLIYVGSAANVATAVALSGDATISNTGVLTLSANSVTMGKLSATGTANSAAFLRGDGVWSSTMVGSITASSFLYASDARLKADIEDLADAREKLARIQPVTYHYKSDPAKTPKMGVLAQEVKAVFPQAVATDQTGMMAVDYPALVPALIEAVNELSAKVDGLEAELQAEKKRKE